MHDSALQNKRVEKFVENEKNMYISEPFIFHRNPFIAASYDNDM